MCFTFLSLQFGDCKDKVTTKKIQDQQTEVLNTLITNITQSTINNNSASAINEISITLSGSKDVIIDGLLIKQFAKADMINTAQIAQKITDLTTVQNIVDQLLKVQTDINSSTSGSNRVIDSVSEQRIRTLIQNTIQTNLTNTLVNNCIASAVNSTKIDITGANIIFKAVNINQVAETSAKCIISVMNNIVSDIKIPNEISSEIKAVDNVSLSSDWSWVAYVVIAIVSLIIIVVAIIYMLKTKKSPKEE